MVSVVVVVVEIMGMDRRDVDACLGEDSSRE